MPFRDIIARVVIAVGFIACIISMAALLIAPYLIEEFPNLYRQAIIATTFSGCTWFFGMLWLIYLRVMAVKRKPPD